MKTCLIIGIHSFTGRYIAEIFKASGYHVVGTFYQSTNTTQADTYPLNILDYVAVKQILTTHKPDIIIHLAGVSFVVSDDVSLFYNVHIMGTRNILAAIAKNNIPVTKVILTSTGQVYGHHQQPRETTALAPLNDYAVSKWAMEKMAQLWLPEIPIVIARLFNCIGIGQSEKFLVAKILRAFINKEPVIELGQTELKRDFLDVRSAAKYYLLLATAGQAGEIYNVASSQSHSVTEILALFSEISQHHITVKFNPQFCRPNDPASVTAVHDKIMSLPGACAPIPIEKTLRWMFEYAYRH